MKTKVGFVSNSSTTSFVVLGVCLKVDDKIEATFFEKVSETCQCRPIPPKGAKFCPKCGWKTGQTRSKAKKFLKRIASPVGKWGSDYEFSGVKLLVFNGCYLVSCYEATKLDGLAFSPVFSESELTKYKETIKKALGPLGLWDEKKFGFYGHFIRD